MAGFRHLLACEFVEEARKTYAANFPGVPVFGGDIRKLSVEEVLAAIGLKPGELDVFEGSPPCSSFSTAGKGAKGWGKAKKYSDEQGPADRRPLRRVPPPARRAPPAGVRRRERLRAWSRARRRASSSTS
jgi:hypothetical protein